VSKTVERESLLGAAYKRKAIVAGIKGGSTLENQALKKMYDHYRYAESAAKQGESPFLPYLTLNRMAGELVLNVGRSHWKGFNPLDVAGIRQHLADYPPDFWNLVSQTELRLYQAAGAHDLERQRASIEGEYEKLYARVPSVRFWRSVYGQAAFVLPKYAASAAPNEREAANALLETLALLAGTERSSARARTDVFVSSARPDKDLAAQLAIELESFGHASLTSLEKAEICIVIVSKWTEHPTIALSREWSVILEKAWSEGAFQLFLVKRQRNAVAPAFLKGVETVELQASAGSLVTIAREIAGKVHRTVTRQAV
jgi:hypothetical protein